MTVGDATFRLSCCTRSGIDEAAIVVDVSDEEALGLEARDEASGEAAIAGGEGSGDVSRLQ